MRLLGYKISAIEFLILVNILVYFTAIFLPYPLVRENLTLIPADVFERPWTLLSSMFMHSLSDPYHLMFNMFALYFFGIYLLPMIGERNFLKIYFYGGIAGGLLFVSTAYLLEPMGLGSPLVGAVGASGAIFAIAAALAVIEPNMTVYMLPFPVPMKLWVAVFVFMGILSFVVPNVAWAAHMGGLVVGVLYGQAYKRMKRSQASVYEYGRRF